MLREVLIGEAMHALGIPTTRALAVVATGALGAIASRCAARRRTDARGRKPHPSVGIVPVLRVARRFRARAQAGRVFDRSGITPELATSPQPFLWRCCKPSSSDRPR